MVEGTSTSYFTAWAKNILFVIIVGALAYIYFEKPVRDEKNRLENVLAGLLAEERSVNLSTNLPIAVGFGSCLDILVDGIPLMNALGVPPPSEPKYHENIETIDQVAEMFAFYLSKGAAAERYIPLTLLKELVTAAAKLERAVWATGGNAPTISKRFALEGFQNVAIGAHASKKFKSLYPVDLKFTDVTDKEDDIHLVLEFKVNEQWGRYKVTRANRFIVHSDQSNPYIGALESFEKVVKRDQPRLIVAGALQMLDNFPFQDGVREKRIKALSEFLKDIPQSTLIHFEMASFSEIEMMKLLQNYVLPYADSLGMNEQELPNILSIIKHGKIIEVAESNPRTAIILDQVRELYNIYKTKSRRVLSRIHLHTLSFQVMLIKKGSAWKNTKAGAAKASLVAHRYVCGTDKITVDKARLIMDDSFQSSLKGDSSRIYFDERSPISCWEESDYEICIAPVLVCTKVKQTAGGGDNITPAGLMMQI